MPRAWDARGRPLNGALRSAVTGRPGDHIDTRGADANPLSFIHAACIIQNVEERTANLLGALTIALADALREATEAAAGHGGAGPAALTTAAQIPGATVGSLGQHVGLSQPAGVRVVDRLAAEGLVEREHGRDGREVVVAVTEAGTERAARVLAARMRVLEEALAILSAEDRERLESLLEQMLQHITVDIPHACLICRLCEVPACPQDRCPVTLGARETSSPELETATGPPDPAERAGD